MRNIAFIMPTYIGGGAERVTDILSLMLNKLYGYKTTIFVHYTESRYVESARAKGIDVRLLPDEYEKRDTNFEYHSPEFTRKTGKLLHEGKYSVAVMCMRPLCDISILRNEAPDCKLLFHLHGKPFFEVKDKLNSKKIKGSHISTLWRCLRENTLHTYRHSTEKYYRNIYNQVDGFITLCDSYKKEIDRILKVDPSVSKVVALYNPLPEIDKYNNDNTTHGKTVLFVGRLSYTDKRPDRMLRIWSHVAATHPGWTLKIVGDGPYRHELEQMSSDLAINSSVCFCGYAADPSQYYAEASILCLTSDFEGWGLVLVEAQAAGVWPISFKVSAGVAEIIGTDHTRGSLIEPYSEKAYYLELERMMNNPNIIEQNRKKMISSTKKYSITQVAQVWDKYISGLLQPK